MEYFDVSGVVGCTIIKHHNTLVKEWRAFCKLREVLSKRCCYSNKYNVKIQALIRACGNLILNIICFQDHTELINGKRIGIL